VRGDGVFISKETILKKLIDNRGSSATSQFDSVMSKLKDNDLLLALNAGEGNKIGLSASLEGNISKMTVVAEFPTQSIAETYKTIAEGMNVDGIEVKSVSSEGNFVYVEAEGEIDKVMEIMAPGAGPPESASPLTGGLPVTPIKPEDLPCQSVEECKDYCTENPAECQQLVENYSKSPCCSECLTAFAYNGYGLDKISMQCSSLDLTSNCSSYFKDTPHSIVECYKG
jgi:hypothetical protein